MKSLASPSAFAQWVFYHTKGGPEPTAPECSLLEQERRERCQVGLVDHNDIDRLRSKTANHLIGIPDDYEVLFADNENNRYTAFEMPSLQVCGRMLRGRPDLIFINRKVGHIVIVERKTTRQLRILDQHEHSNWKNIQAQLWCYSQITEWADCEHVTRITLVGELWRNHKNVLAPALEPFIWQKGDADHERTCRELFEKYCRWVRLQSL